MQPIVNWKKSPAYKITKRLNNILQDTLQLPYTFNVKNSTTLIHTLTQIKIDENTRLCSFDIENMYTNIPRKDVRNIINKILNRNNVKEIAKERNIKPLKCYIRAELRTDQRAVLSTK
jgi:hypothetical protein